jgi:hypothetical protein
MVFRRRAVIPALIFSTLLFLFYFLNYVRNQIYDRTFAAPLELARPNFTPGIAKPASENYTRTLVMGRLRDDDVSWVDTLPDLNTAIYVVDDDDPNARLRIPKNKGHEAMVYLTYIIDHYDELPSWPLCDLRYWSSVTSLSPDQDAHILTWPTVAAA